MGSYGTFAQGPLPLQYEGIGIDEKLGDYVSPDTRFRDSAGREVTIGDFLNQGRPVVISFVYHNCPMLCSLILDGLSNQLSRTSLEAGTDFEMLSISFDPREGPERSAEARERYLARTPERNDLVRNWHFLTGSQEAIDQITNETGFRVRWIEEQQDFAHAAGLIFLSPSGQIARYLYGIEFPDQDFRYAALEAGRGSIGSAVDRLLLFCYIYDAEAGTYMISMARLIMMIGGGIFLLALISGLGGLWLRELRRPRVRPEDLDLGLAPTA